MAVQIICPNLRCRKILMVPNDARGKTVRCMHCQTLLRVPDGKKGAAHASSAGGEHHGPSTTSA